MTPRQVFLVQDSFRAVESRPNITATLFYQRLFELDPCLKPVFKSDYSEDGKKLMTMLSTVVNELDDLEVILPAVQSLGRRHVEYGMKKQDYDTVGAALLWALEKTLESDFSDDVQKAWAQTYNFLTDTMKSAITKVA